MDSATGQVGAVSSTALGVGAGGGAVAGGDVNSLCVGAYFRSFFFLKIGVSSPSSSSNSPPPERRPVLTAVGIETSGQLRTRKFIEILIVTSATFITLSFLGLNYAALLGVLVGLSVLIPFVWCSGCHGAGAYLVGIIQFGRSWI